MQAVVTYCSGPKRDDGGLLPAVVRYRSERIAGLAEAARTAGRPFLILSGRFGLIPPHQPIPWYDHLLPASAAEAAGAEAAATLRAGEITAVQYHTADPESHPAVAPYLTAIRTACGRAGIRLEIVLLAGNPD